MRITEVKTAVLFGSKVFVRVYTDEGLTGIGECSPMNGPVIKHFIDTVLTPLVVGQDPRETDRLWTTMLFRPYKLGVQGVHLQAMSGVDIALWDILGKAAGMSISTLLGGRYRERVRMYCSIGGGATMSPLDMARRVERALADGFTAIKIRMDWGYHQDVDPAKDWAMFQECKRVTGDDIPLSFDANCGYSASTAIQQGRRFESLGIAHFEEPCAPYDYAATARVADALDVPVSSGEHEYTRWQFRDLILQGNVDIIQPDVVKCGGISEMKRIAVLGETFNRKFLPHQTQPTVGMAANLHVIASLRDATLPQEFTGVEARLQALYKEPLVFKDGHITLPSAPGLGLELDDRAFEQAAAAG